MKGGGDNNSTETQNERFSALLDVALEEYCQCDDAHTTPNYCLWCFKIKGCDAVCCPLVLLCEYPKCTNHKLDQSTAICSSCIRSYNNFGWRYGINAKDGKIALFCPRHKQAPLRNQTISISIMQTSNNFDNSEETQQSPQKRLKILNQG